MRNEHPSLTELQGLRLHDTDDFIPLPTSAASLITSITPSCSEMQCSSAKENQTVFDNEYKKLAEVLDVDLEDRNAGADFSFIAESTSLPDPNKQDVWKLWNRYITEEWKARGDSVLRDVLSDWVFSHRTVPSEGVGSNQDGGTCVSWSGSEPSLAESGSLGLNPGTGNVNSNMSQGPGRQGASTGEGVPVPRHREWRRKSRSTPELRGPVNREEPLRRRSQYDVPYSLGGGGRRRLDVNLPEDSDEPLPHLLWGEDAYRHYRMLTMIERKENLNHIQSAKNNIIKKYMWKQRVLQKIVDTAKAYYDSPTDQNREKWKELRAGIGQSRDHSMTDLQYVLGNIPTHLPFVTVILMIAHVLSLTVMCIVGKLGPVGVLSEKEVARGVQTFLGAETVHRYVIPNPWIGPPVRIVLHFGASYALCMRWDHQVEAQGKARKFRLLDDSSFGCCEMRGPLNAAGTTTLEECNNYTNNAGVWSHPLCSKRQPGKNSVAHVIRPCCVNHQGTCNMLSYQHCAFLGGKFHVEAEHCVQVMCVADVCRIGRNLSLIGADSVRPWLPDSGTGWQYWRLLLALFFTYGVLHCLALLALEALLMWPMERSNGWFPVFFVFTVCGVASQIVACTAQPYVPHVGSTGGVAGLVGEAAVELKQAWILLEHPGHEVLKLASYLVVLLVMGLLPFVSLLGSLAGCVCGAACAFICMPYLTFNKRDKARKRLLMTAGGVVLFIFFTVTLITFDRLQPHPCQACRRVECLSFTDDMCNHWDLLG